MGQRRFGIRVLTVFGTRPEAIKLAPVIRAIEAQPDMTSRVCVTAQHREMLDQVLDIFAIVPHHDLDVMTPRQSLASLTARALEGVSGVLDAERPDLVLVQGDTTSAFVSALAAFYHRVPVGHVEAGLRTDDRYNPFPEELNRRLAGVLADLHWAPTARARDNLIREGIAPECITVTGNTVIDALLDVTSRPWPAHDGGLPSPGERIVLITAHRRESLGAPLVTVADDGNRLVGEQRQVSVGILIELHRPWSSGGAGERCACGVRSTPQAAGSSQPRTLWSISASHASISARHSAAMAGSLWIML